MKEREITINRIDSELENETNELEIRRPINRRGNQRRRRPVKSQLDIRKKRLTKTVIIATIILMIGIIGWGISRIGFNSEPDPNILVDDIVEDKVSVLLVGADGGGYNTDTLMLALMDCKNHKLNLMSIPRDTRVPNPYGGSGYAKINSVYAAKGMSGLIEQIGKITGLPVNFYVKIDFEGFRKAIDTLGGVQFDVPMRLYYKDPEQNLYIDLQPGLQLLDGDKSEQLVRARSQYAQADIKRTEIQREFLKELIKQHATASNLFKVGDLYNIMSKYTTTNITLSDAIKYAPSLTKVSDEDIQMFILPGTTNEGGVSYWLYDAAQMERLANDVFWYDVKIRPTPRPTLSPAKTPTPAETPQTTNTPDPNVDDEVLETPKPTTSTTPKPTNTAKPTPSSSSKPSTPKPTNTPVPSKNPQTPTPTTPQPTYNPGQYPDGI